MTGDIGRTTLRNMLLGRWVAETLGMTGPDADAYAAALAAGTRDPAASDVFSKIRKDFDAAGVAQSDEEILRVMTDLMLKAGNHMPSARGQSLDASAVMLSRKLTTW